MGARNRVGIGSPGIGPPGYTVHSLEELVPWNGFLGSLKVYEKVYITEPASFLYIILHNTFYNRKADLNPIFFHRNTSYGS
jgi:hypothetical protein